MRALPATVLFLVLAVVLNGCTIRTGRRYRWGWQPSQTPSGFTAGNVGGGGQVVGGSVPLPLP
jgi:hypothetical protein